MSSSPESRNAAKAKFTPFTKAERIRQLNEIDKSINQLLKSAGLAIQTLSPSHSSASPPLSERRNQFEKNSNSYLRILQTVDVGLHRQIYGLEEEGIIPTDKGKKEKANLDTYATIMKPQAEKDSVSADGGMGKFDIGYLNSKSGRVSRDMEAELWAKARKLLEGMESNRYSQRQAEQKGES